MKAAHIGKKAILSTGSQFFSRLVVRVVLVMTVFIPSSLQLSARELQIGTVPREYTVQHYFFQVVPETSRARIVVRYTWPEYVEGPDQGPGPLPVPIQIDVLSYDAANGTVVYDDGELRTVCGSLRARHFLRWKWSSVFPTGACTVISREVLHVNDTGWDLHRHLVSETFLEVH